MTLDEAINHAEEVAEEQEELYRICPLSESEVFHCDGTKDCKSLKNGENKGCQKYAAEHRQLAEWLRELKRLRELPSVEPERKVGHWIIHSDDLFPSESTQECSQCHEHQPLYWRCSDNYCPNCGAKMVELQGSEEKG